MTGYAFRLYEQFDTSEFLAISPREISDLPRRYSKNCDPQFTSTDRFKANYSIDSKESGMDPDSRQVPN